MTRTQACAELRELGFQMKKMFATGSSRWELGTRTIFIASKGPVGTAIIASARAYALSRSIADVPTLAGKS